MTLFRQLFLGISLLFFVLLTGIEAIYLASSRAELQDQLASQAQDAATSIALRLATLKTLEDRLLVETLVGPVFDRGYFQEIVVLDEGGKPVVHKILGAAQGDVPEWFARLFPLRGPAAQSLVSSGWRELGRVVVLSHPNFAYQRLWHTGARTLLWLVLLYAAALIAMRGFLARLLRPLRQIELLAVSVGERDFRTISLMPRARELARVVAAMNGMSARIARIIAEESERAEALRRDAFVDPVTSLYNRRGFQRQLESLIRSRSEVFSGALVLVEIAKFGDFNSKAGFRRGDEVLALLGESIVQVCQGQAAVCGRIGGAGFAIGAINIGAGELQDLVEAACRRMALVLAEQGIEAELHFHCGATRRDGALPEFSVLLASADHALQRARERGDNQFEVEPFDEAMALGAQDWRARIEQALAERRIALFAQDVLGISGARPVHREVTARMTRDDGEPVPAAQFLPMAARHGLLPRLDVCVLEKLLEHLAGAKPSVDMALNVAARTIADPAAVRRICALLEAKAGLASALIVEITEFGVLQDGALARAFGEELRRRGARLALDHFGMQQNSLALVHALKPHYIKLSPAYAREIAGDADTRFFVTSILRIARSLDVGVYAQAVEDEGLVRLLAELGFSGYQGYAAARPERIA